MLTKSMVGLCAGLLAIFAAPIAAPAQMRQLPQRRPR
jgi:hypothetical protein